MDFGLFWKFHYLLNGARKPLKMAWGVLSQLLELLLLIPHSPMFGPTVMIMMMIMMIMMMMIMVQTSITDRCPEETHVRHLDQPHNLKTLTIALFGESVFSNMIPTI